MTSFFKRLRRRSEEEESPAPTLEPSLESEDPEAGPAEGEPLPTEETANATPHPPGDSSSLLPEPGSAPEGQPMEAPRILSREGAPASLPSEPDGSPGPVASPSEPAPLAELAPVPAGSTPPPSEPARPPLPSVRTSASPRAAGRRGAETCFVCGTEMNGSYCPTCRMTWID